MNDIRYTARILATSPGFALVIVGLLSIGIGASAVMFSAFDTILLRPLPVRHPEELVRMVQKIVPVGARSHFPYSFYRDLREHSTTLAAVFGETQLTVAINQPAPAEVIHVRLPTPEFFDALGVSALYGRTLTASDANESSDDPPAVLSHGFWRRRFGGDPAAIGRTIALRSHRFVIVGVMPPQFNGVAVETSPDVRVPLRAYPLLASADTELPMEKSAMFELAGRLKSEMTPARAQAECLAIWRQATEAYYRDIWKLQRELLDVYLSRGMELDPLSRGVSILRDRFGGALKLLIGCAGLLLMLVSANVAGLLLARNAMRRQEIAIRLAVGATRWRVVRQLLIEGVLLAAGGGAGGLMIAAVSGPLLVRALPPIRDAATNELTLTVQLGADWRVFLFSLAICVLTVLLFGLAPALTASRASLDSVLRSVRSSRGWRGRQVAVIVQIAFCTVLLAGAGLLVRTLNELRELNPGFDRDRVVTLTVNPGLAGYTAAQTSNLRAELVERVRALPGVRSAATALVGVMRNSGLKTTIAPAGERLTGTELNASINTVSIDYFSTMGMQILSGRGLTSADSPSIIPISVVVNEAFARQFFPNTDPLGKLVGTISTGMAPAQYEIVGIVNDAKYRSLREPMTPTFYPPLRDTGFFQLLVRTPGRPELLVETIGRTVTTLDPAVPISDIHTLAEEVESSISGERLTATLASMFAIVAALLAAVGIYGLLTQLVTERRQEIGIRMAVGACPRDIGKLVGRQAFAMVAVGVLLGLGAALLGGSWIRSLLYGVAPTDPVSLASATVFLILMAIVATAVPVIRGTRIELAATLRQEN